MTETAEPPEPAPRRRRVRRRRRPRVGEWVGQAALIVFGVVVGLALNEWRAGLADEARTDRVLAALADEVAANRAAVASSVEYYGRMVQGAQNAIDERGPDVTYDLREIDGYTGDIIPTLTAGTYDAATATGALLGADIGRASTLSSAYASQQAFQDALADNGLTRMSRATPQLTVWRAGTIYSYGQDLMERYDGALARLNPAP